MSYIWNERYLIDRLLENEEKHLQSAQKTKICRIMVKDVQNHNTAFCFATPLTSLC
jgi:hypothetical protein